MTDETISEIFPEYPAKVQTSKTKSKVKIGAIVNLVAKITDEIDHDCFKLKKIEEVAFVDPHFEDRGLYSFSNIPQAEIDRYKLKDLHNVYRAGFNFFSTVNGLENLIITKFSSDPDYSKENSYLHFLSYYRELKNSFTILCNYI